MADKSYVTVILRQTVATPEEALLLSDVVKAKFADDPSVDVKVHFSKHFDLEEGL